MLDRKVVYDISADAALTCGRRAKGSSHKLQLGGTGIEPEHCAFEQEGDHVRIKPLSEKAMGNIRVNGKPIESMEGLILKPNDRICLGPSAVFLFKNKQHEEDASMPDPDDDPISFDFASEEVLAEENKEQQQEKDDMKKLQEEEN